MRTRSALVDFVNHSGAHNPPVAQHGHAIGQPEDFLQPVRDVDDRDTSIAQPAHHVKQRFGFMLAQRRGRLIHDQEPDLIRQRLGYLDKLLFRDPQFCDQRMSRDGDA